MKEKFMINHSSFIAGLIKQIIVISISRFSYIVIFTIFLNKLSYAQNSNKADSLERLLKTLKFDSTRTISQIELIYIYYQNDTVKANKLLGELSGNIDNQTYDIDPKWIFEVGNMYSNYRNDFTNTIKYYGLAVKKAKEQNDYMFIYYESWLGYVYSNIGEHENARKHSINAVEIAESMNIEDQLPTCYLILAFVYRNANEMEKAIENFTKSYEKSIEIGDSSNIHTALHEIGNVYYILGDYKSAIEYHKKALLIREKLNSISYLMYSYNDIANDYLYTDSIQIALDYYLKAAEFAEMQNNKYALFRILLGVENAYLSLEDFEKGKKILSKMKIIADELNVKSIFYDLNNVLYGYYKRLGNYENALKYFELASLYKDSISSDEIRKNLDELDKKYETVKKDKELLENQLDIRRQRVIIIFAGIGMLLIAVFMSIVFRQYRQKKRAYTILEYQNQEIVQQKEEIQTQAQYLEQANIEITNQKSIIEISHQQITSSITYAKRIQEAVLPKEDVIQMLLPQHFILFKPRNIVSGDFYFIKLYKNYLFVAAADCTGHGVPGAFMSMLGFALLNDLVRKPEIQNSAQLLDELRLQIKTSLQQTGKIGEPQDGMDIAFLAIDIETNMMSYAGANFPLYLFRDNELFVYKADSMPISIFRRENNFTNHNIELKKDDVLYIFSDGYVSQFDENNQSTFKISRFREMLINIHKKSFSEQKEILENELNNWKGNSIQTDDILVIGVKI